jgi:hypothetical protein
MMIRRSGRQQDKEDEHVLEGADVAVQKSFECLAADGTGCCLAFLRKQYAKASEASRRSKMTFPIPMH